jgi:hypothetical protein
MRLDPINVTVFAETTIKPVHSAAGYKQDGTDYFPRH